MSIFKHCPLVWWITFLINRMLSFPFPLLIFVHTWTIKQLCLSLAHGITSNDKIGYLLHLFCALHFNIPDTLTKVTLFSLKRKQFTIHCVCYVIHHLLNRVWMHDYIFTKCIFFQYRFSEFYFREKKPMFFPYSFQVSGCIYTS